MELKIEYCDRCNTNLAAIDIETMVLCFECYEEIFRYLSYGPKLD